MVSFETLEVVSPDGLVMVELIWLEEGNNGDYIEEDKDDTPLLRYTLYRKYSDGCDPEKMARLCDGDAYVDDDWAAVRDGSYCTQLSAVAPREQLQAAAEFILFYVAPGLRDYKHQKRLYEQLSWIGLLNGQPYCEINTKGD